MNDSLLSDYITFLNARFIDTTNMSHTQVYTLYNSYITVITQLNNLHIRFNSDDSLDTLQSLLQNAIKFNNKFALDNNIVTKVNINTLTVYSNDTCIHDLFITVNKYRNHLKNMGFDTLHAIISFQSTDNTFDNIAIINRSILIHHFDSLDSITNWFSNLLDSPNTIRHGSGGVNTEQYELIPNRVDISYTTSERITAFGTSIPEESIFNTIDYKYSYSYCGLAILQLSGVKMSQKYYRELKLFIVDNYVKYVKDNNVNISIAIHCPLYIDSITREATLNWLHKVDSPYSALVAHNSHWYLCKGTTITVQDKFYIMNDNVYSDSKLSIPLLLRGRCSKCKKNNRNINIQTKYLFVDLETVIDWTTQSKLSVYSVSALLLDYNQLHQLHTYDYNQNSTDLQQFIHSNCYNWIGNDCMFNFSNTLINQWTKEYNIVICTFNGSVFDHYIIYQHLHSNCNHGVFNPIIYNSHMYNIPLSPQHRTIDLLKFLQGSLKQNCIDFGLTVCSKKDGYNHGIVQNNYDNCTLWKSFLHNNKDNIKTYNNYDCIAMAVIFYRLRNAIVSIPTFDNYYIENRMTIGKLMYDRFTTSLKDILNGKDVLNKDVLKLKPDNNTPLWSHWFNIICSNRVAGRVQLFNNTQIIKDTTLASLDVVSLYPYVMAVAPNSYPCGDIIECSNWESMPSDTIGFFICDVDQSILDIKLIAKKYPDGNSWNENILNNVCLSSIIIHKLLSLNCKVTVYNGIYFTDTVQGCDLFNCIVPIIKCKMEQDVLKINNNPNYNPTLRNTYKLMLNILSGKINQKLTTSKNRVIPLREYLLRHYANNNSNYINSSIVSVDKIHVVEHVNTDSALIHAKPIHIGSCIYDYARIYMYDHAYTKFNKEDLLYTDTDSCKVPLTALHNWIQNYASITTVPVVSPLYDNYTLFGGRQFGCFLDEYKNHNYSNAMFLGKKMYLCYNSTNTDIEFHFKGVNSKDVLIPHNYSLNDNLHNIYNDPYKFGLKRIQDDYTHFTNELLNCKHVNIATFQFDRIHSNGYYISCRHHIKKLQIDDTNESFNTDNADITDNDID